MSRKRSPWASTPLKNRGICNRILGERRRSAGLKRDHPFAWENIFRWSSTEVPVLGLADYLPNFAQF